MSRRYTEQIAAELAARSITRTLADEDGHNDLGALRHLGGLSPEQIDEIRVKLLDLHAEMRKRAGIFADKSTRTIGTLVQS